MRKVYSVNLDPTLVARVDAVTGSVSRSRWIERTLEQALGGARPEMSGGLRQDGADTSRAPAEEPRGVQRRLPADVFRQPVTDFKAAALVRQAKLNKSKGMGTD